MLRSGLKVQASPCYGDHVGQLPLHTPRCFRIRTARDHAARSRFGGGANLLESQETAEAAPGCCSIWQWSRSQFHSPRQIFHSPWPKHWAEVWPSSCFLATVGYFVANTFPVACAISMTERKSLPAVWKECYFWALPYYLLGAAMVRIVDWVNHNLGWEFSLMVMPIGWVVLSLIPSLHRPLGDREGSCGAGERARGRDECSAYPHHRNAGFGD